VTQEDRIDLVAEWPWAVAVVGALLIVVIDYWLGWPVQ